MADGPIVAIGPLTQRDLDRLGKRFAGAIPVPSDSAFEDLLAQLDVLEADRIGSGLPLRLDAGVPSDGNGRDEIPPS